MNPTTTVASTVYAVVENTGCTSFDCGVLELWISYQEYGYYPDGSQWSTSPEDNYSIRMINSDVAAVPVPATAGLLGLGLLGLGFLRARSS